MPLPPLAALVAADRPFAHPFEQHFARLLDRYRIRWSYEPTTFLLGRRPDGSPAECFTPDFYLPDLGTYVELTSMRQPLVTRKHRKLRRFRAAFPETRVVMLYRRDYHRMLSAWSMASERHGPTDDAAGLLPAAARTLFAGPAIDNQLDRLAWQLGERYGALGEAPLLIALGHGGRRVAQDLGARLTRIGMAPVLDALVATEPGGPVRLHHGAPEPLAGRLATLVTTVVSTGLAAAFAANWLRRRGTSGVEVCALLDRASARVVAVPLRYECLPAPVEHLVGYGLEHRWQYRDLPSIAVLDVPYDGPLLAGPV